MPDPSAAAQRMTIIDRGVGTAVIVVPGIQGRWEWHRPLIEAMAKHCRVITFSFADELGADAPFNAHSSLDSYCDQTSEAMAAAGLSAAAVCGISYGGLVAAAFAARHADRVSALVLASALSPSWKAPRRIVAYLRAPRLLSPLFMLASLRLLVEIRSASPSLTAAVQTALRHGWNVLTHMFSPGRMARRARQLADVELGAEMQRIGAPTLIVVGERDLDRVVPVSTTLQYLEWLPDAQVVTLERTGHLGSITRPDAFADLVVRFAQQHADSLDSRKRLG